MFYNLDNINIEEINLPREPVATKLEKKAPRKAPKKVSWVDQQPREKLLTNLLSGKLNEITLTVEDFIEFLCLFSQQKKTKKLSEFNFVFEHLDLIRLFDYFQLKIEQLDKQTIKNANRSIRNIDQMITEIKLLENQIKTDCEQKLWDF